MHQGCPVEIEEFRPEPSKPQPPEPKRKALSAFVVSLVMVATFLVSLAVLNWNDLTTPAPRRPPVQGEQLPPKRVRSAVPAAHSIETMETCISTNVLSASELAQVRRTLADQANAPEPPTTPALSEGVPDMHAISNQQAAEFAGLLTRIDGTLGDRARMAFQQGITEGVCALASHAATAVPPPQWPDAKLQ
jgi:hypothetical protein